MAVTTKRILVTGANKGIGAAICRRLLREHPETSVLLGSRDHERGEAAVRSIVEAVPGSAGRIECVQLDVADESSVDSAAAKVADKFSSDSAPLYGIINNAGIYRTDTLAEMLQTNVRGAVHVCNAFMPLLSPTGRISNVSSGSAPRFVENLKLAQLNFFLNKGVTWGMMVKKMRECEAIADEDFEKKGFGDGTSPGHKYGLSKAMLNSYTMLLARKYPDRRINSCSPGYIETDMTRHHCEAQGKSPQELGMKSADDGSFAPCFLIMGNPVGTGWYYGSDAKRSPLHMYRSPGSPEYMGE